MVKFIVTGGVPLLAGISLLGIYSLVAIVTFTSVTLAIGDPFYEKISERVDRRLGYTTPAVNLPWYKEIVRSLGESIHAHHSGYKESGIGGEDGKWGLMRYTQIKTAYHHYG